MEDTTNNLTNGQDTAGLSQLAIDAADLLISDQAAWDVAPPPKFVDSCDNLLVRGVYRNTGDTASIPVECHSWDHQRCAEKHAVRELRRLHRILGDDGKVYYAKVPNLRFESSRLSDRRCELAKTEGVVWYRWYRRDDGSVWILASHPLGGRKSPMTFTPTDRPLRVAAVALRLPGVNRADGSSLKRVPAAVEDTRIESGAEDPESDYAAEEETGVDSDEGSQVAWIGIASMDRWEETQRAAALEAMDRYGVEVDPMHAVTLRSGLTPEEWVVCLKAVRFRKE